MRQRTAAAAFASVSRDLRQLERSAAQARKALRSVGGEGVKGVQDEIDRRGPGIQRSFAKWLLTPNRSLFQSLSRPFATAFATPVVAAIGAVVTVPGATELAYETTLADLRRALQLWRRPPPNPPTRRNYVPAECECGRRIRAPKTELRPDIPAILCEKCYAPFKPADDVLEE